MLSKTVQHHTSIPAPTTFTGKRAKLRGNSTNVAIPLLCGTTDAWNTSLRVSHGGE